jgi:H2-forming N5,N10-methylenetetrahydromethanopterin dehydrogenase-like enzyme
VSQGAKSRELLRVEGKPNGWASLATPLEEDETASNWMTKVDRLRVSEYLGQEPPAGRDALVVRIEYFDARKALGFTELFKTAAEPGAESKNKYVVRTETTRWYGEVLASRAEQVEQDLGSVVSSGAK